MKKIYVLLAFSTLFGALKAQVLHVVGDTANIGVVYENAPDSVLVQFFNAGAYPVLVDKVVGFPFYGDTVVMSNFSNQAIAAGDTVSFFVSAQPEHNVKHKSALVMLMKTSPYGSAIVPYSMQGRYSKSYYNATENKSETALRTQLNATLGTATNSLSYNAARDEMYSDLDNVNGNVTCVYTGRVATFNTRSGATSNNFNCEHTWPQSLFNENLPMKSDIHHLFSTDDVSNSQRGNLPFGTVANPTWTVGGSKKNSSTFEPRDAQKGATARAMMYFVIRYQDYSNFFVNQQAILRQWHEQFPPSAIEIARNNGIYALQNNRSPFVDYPQFSERITSLVGTSTPALVSNLFISDDTLKLAYSSGATGSLTYTVQLVNYGNQNVNVLNIATSDAALQKISPSGSNMVIEPGQALPISISYPIGTNFNGEDLTFTTNVAGFQNVTIPVKASSNFKVEENSWKPQISVTNQRVSWIENGLSFSYNLIDAAGRVLKTGTNRDGEVLLNNLPQGLYILNLQSAKGSYSVKLGHQNLY